jgi:hypothetical protein
MQWGMTEQRQWKEAEISVWSLRPDVPASTLSFSFLLFIQSEIPGQPITQLATCFHAGNLLGLFDPEDGGDNFLRNVG